MTKWQSNLIILGMMVVGLQLAAPEVDRLFYKEIPAAPEKVINKTEKASSTQGQNQNEVQIAPKNATISVSAEKVNTLTGTETNNQSSNIGNSSAPSKANALTWAEFNQMNQSQLEQINGVGPVLAQRILEYRSAHGNFDSFEDLNKVKGIGPKLLEKIKKQFN